MEEGDPEEPLIIPEINKILGSGTRNVIIKYTRASPTPTSYSPFNIYASQPTAYIFTAVISSFMTTKYMQFFMIRRAVP